MRFAWPVVLGALLQAGCAVVRPTGGGPAGGGGTHQPARKAARRAVATRSPASGFAYYHYLRGRLHSIAGRGGEAIGQFKEALVFDPRSAHLHLCIAREYLKVRKPRHAEFWARRALELEPTSAVAYFVLAKAEVGSRRPQAALKHLLRATRASPPVAEAFLDLAHMLARKKKRREARGVLLRMTRRLPLDHRGHFRLALLEFGAGRYAAAVSSLRRSLERKPSHLHSMYYLAVSYERQGKLDRSMATYADYLDYHPRAGGVRLHTALLHLARDKRGDGALAEYHVRRFLYSAGDNATTFKQVGDMYFRGKEYQTATKWYRKALSRAGHRADLRLALAMSLGEGLAFDSALAAIGTLPKKAKAERARAALVAIDFLIRSKKHKRAVVRARELLKARPGDPWTYVHLARALHAGGRKGDRKQALAIVRKALRRWPKKRELQYEEGHLLLKSGQLERALQTMRAVLQQNPRNAEAMNFIGYTLAERGLRLAEAEKLVRGALALKPHAGHFVDSLGWVYYKQGRFALAVRTLERAVRMSIREAAIVAHLADATRAAGKPRRALSLYKRALRYYPEPEVKREILKSMQAVRTALKEKRPGKRVSIQRRPKR